MNKKVESFKNIMDAQFPNAWESGLLALKDDGCGHNYMNRIKPKDKNLLEGSFFIEGYYKPQYKGRSEQPNYWDYAIGYDNIVYFVEIHPASKSSYCTEVKEKYDWLKQDVLPKLKNTNKRFFYVSVGKKSDLSKDSLRKLAQLGIKFRKMYLELPS